MDEEAERVLQAATLRIGQTLARRAAGQRPGLFDATGLRGRLLGRALRDEVLRTRLFRFVDVLPQLPDEAAIAAHFRAYLDGFELGGLWGRALKLGNAPLGAYAVRRSVRRLAGLFLAEESPHELAVSLARLARLPARVSLDAVGEAVLGEAEADAYRDRVLGLIHALAETSDADVSVKLSALTPRFDPIDPTGSSERVWRRLAPIAEAARTHGVALTVDMEQAALKPLIQSIFLQLARDYPQADFRVGIALQAYLKDAASDLASFIAHARKLDRPLAVRLVKGAYWDSEQAWAAQRDWPLPVFLDKAATDRQFETLTRQLMNATDVIYPMIASHNLRSQAHALALARQLGLAANAWEAQTLYGMAEPLRDALIAEGVTLRVYLPTGDLVTGIAYLIRRLLENTAGTSILRQAYVDAQPLDVLLAEPIPTPQTATLTTPAFANAPLADLSQTAQREAMVAALVQVRGELGQDYPVPAGGEWIVSTNPANSREVIGCVQAVRPQQVDAGVTAALAAFPRWRDTPTHARAEHLRAAARLIAQDRARFAAWEVLEAGKNWREADADVAEAVDVLNYYASGIEALDGWRPNRHDPGELNDSRYEAVGPAAIVAPWNFPLAILAGMSAAALAAGCPVLLKPASLTPVIAWHYRQVLLAAGIPPEAVQWLPGCGHAIGSRLVTHPDVAAVAFTGSREVGLDILAAAHARLPGQRLIKRVVCEMGGKNAIVVDEDADLDEAVVEILASAFGYQGQKCSAASRVIAVGRVHDRLVERLAATLDAFEIGPPEQTRYPLGPLIDAAAVEKALAYLEIGAREGRLAYAGRVPLDELGHYFAPAIFSDIQPQHRLAREEIFAPILSVLRAADFSSALDIALDSDYALTGGVFSRLPAHLELARTRFRVGNLYLNRGITGAKVGLQPFGGVALSGGGIQAGGPDYLKQFLWMRTVSENTLRHGFVP
jgi:RHH-type transcriptional regulator, proline utilization regulon repressor / proline dehydrogenase / delta 1-pyrroline-5-carboxylate dehydrogenase